MTTTYMCVITTQPVGTRYHRVLSILSAFPKEKTMLCDAQFVQPGEFECWLDKAQRQVRRAFTGKERAELFYLWGSCCTVEEALIQLRDLD
ncbi:hypothetical protein [Paraburkholderia caribensis]|uniref:hypothetical protein n=1 Tax=Paraburkholderia caribensis TaxID=75105 RepID=UPI000721267D|nr:hypothetical protein [Paraburkholderia caribensis]ALP62373.1 hypothetical protein AN416_07015 [Paraburkholderia caribensis]AUT52400.1 hypothetical protein C2L66_11400 [Paraburkholderia caribensis]